MEPRENKQDITERKIIISSSIISIMLMLYLRVQYYKIVTVEVVKKSNQINTWLYTILLHGDRRICISIIQYAQYFK